MSGRTGGRPTAGGVVGVAPTGLAADGVVARPLPGGDAWRAASRALAGRFADPRRALTTGLALLWLLDGALQLQSFMFSRGFIHMLTGMAAGQPPWLSASIRWAAGVAAGHQVVLNSLFAVTQVAIGLGLLHRRTLRLALVASFGWAFVVWWFGEGFGMLFMDMAAPLTGAPGAVILYGLAGAILWPGERPGGLLGVRGARIAWAILWLGMAWLWLEAPSSAPNGVSGMIDAAPSGMSWLSTLQLWTAGIVRGDGLIVAILFALLSAGVGLGVATGRRPRAWLAVSVAVSVAYWLLGQGLGGIFQGDATDPGAAPLFVLLAGAMLWLAPHQPTAEGNDSC